MGRIGVVVDGRGTGVMGVVGSGGMRIFRAVGMSIAWVGVDERRMRGGLRAGGFEGWLVRWRVC